MTAYSWDLLGKWHVRGTALPGGRSVMPENLVLFCLQNDVLVFRIFLFTVIAQLRSSRREKF